MKIAMAYADFAAGQRAMSVSQAYLRQLGADRPALTHSWQFDVLNVPELRRVAVQETAGADLVIVSAQADEDLPEQVKSWIAQWQARRRTNCGTLVALLNGIDDPSKMASPAYICLAEVAQNAGMELIVRCFGLPEAEVQFSPERLSERAHASSSVLEGILSHSQSYFRWGLNE